MLFVFYLSAKLEQSPRLLGGIHAQEIDCWVSLGATAVTNWILK
jgi:hypothetical protein